MRKRALGIYYGYPECCITAFENGNYSKVGSRYHGLGFVPCPKCSTLPYESMVGIIQKHRICSRPFPETCDLAFVLSDISDSTKISQITKETLKIGIASNGY